MKSALAIVAHPDDIEFYAAGTLLRLAQAGFALHFWNLADGCLGSRTVPADELRTVRAGEAARSAHCAGAVLHPPLFRDMEITYSPAATARVAAVIREVEPELLFTHPPDDYMRDHEVTCQLTVAGAFARTMPNFVSDPPRHAIDTPTRIYHLMPHSGVDFRSRPVSPDLLVSIDAVIDKKSALLACHRSQRDWLAESQGMQSLEAEMRGWAATMGKLSGAFALAEGFIRHHHIGFCDPGHDPLPAALPPETVALLEARVAPAPSYRRSASTTSRGKSSSDGWRAK